MKLSLCITTFNRYSLLLESFAQVIDDPRISEIVIVDDCSELTTYDKIAESVKDIPKVRLYRQARNRGMGQNKADAISYATNDWCIIFDSDNVIDKSYLDAFILNIQFIGLPNITNDTIFCPDFAKPKFDYRKFGNQTINKLVNKDVINDQMGNCLFNTCNYIVHRDTYLKVYQPNPETKGTDTIWFNYLWLKAGNSFYVVPNMQYYHRVHDESGFLKDCAYNMKKAEEVKKMILAL